MKKETKILVELLTNLLVVPLKLKLNKSQKRLIELQFRNACNILNKYNIDLLPPSKKEKKV